MPASSAGPGLCAWIDGKKRNVRDGRGIRCRLPLDAIVPAKFSWGHLFASFDTVTPDPTLLTLARWLSTDELTSRLKPPQTARRFVSRIPAVYDAADTLEAQGTFRKVTTASEFGDLGVFTVAKSNGTSSRLIVDCRPLNEQIAETLIADTTYQRLEMGLPKMDEIVEALTKTKIVSVSDLRSFFYQIPVHSSWWPLLQFAVSGTRGEFRRYQLTVLPMGLSIAPLFAQRLANHILAVAGVEGKVIAWVDNFVGVTASCREDVGRVRRVAEEMGLIWKEGTFDELIETDVLGLHWAAGNLAPTEQHKATLRKLQPDSPFTAAQLFGICIWVNWTLLRHPLCYYPLVMERMRSIARAGKWADKTAAALGPAEAEEWARLTQECTNAKVREETPQMDEQLPTLWTDAAEALGAVLEDGEREATAIFAADPSERIEIRELRAGYEASCHFESLEADRSFVWKTDSTVAFYAAIKGHSGTAQLDLILRRWIRSGRFPARVGWVPSECQRADPLTRRPFGAPRARCAHDHRVHNVRFQRFSRPT